MYLTLSTFESEDILARAGFSSDAARALVQYLEEYEEETGQDIQLDSVGLRCSFYEESLADIITDYGSAAEDNGYGSDVLSYLEDNTTLIGVNEDTYLVEVF